MSLVSSVPPWTCTSGVHTYITHGTHIVWVWSRLLAQEWCMLDAGLTLAAQWDYSITFVGMHIPGSINYWSIHINCSCSTFVRQTSWCCWCCCYLVWCTLLARSISTSTFVYVQQNIASMLYVWVRIPGSSYGMTIVWYLDYLVVYALPRVHGWSLAVSWKTCVLQ